MRARAQLSAALKAPASLTLRLSARPARRVHVAGAGPEHDAKPPAESGGGGFFPALFGAAGFAVLSSPLASRKAGR